MSSQLQQYVPVAALLGFGSATWLSSYIASFNIHTVPAVKENSNAQQAAKEWKKAFEIGMATAPPFAIASATCFGFLAYATRGISGRFAIPPSILYGTAAVLTPSIVPFTVVIMKPSTLTPLIAKALGQGDAPSDDETWSLMKTWTAQNAVRAAMVGTAAVMSAVAILSQVA